MLLAHQSDSSALSKPNTRTLSLATNLKQAECRSFSRVKKYQNSKQTHSQT